MGGRWGGRSSGSAGQRDFPRLARDENESEKRRRAEAKEAPYAGTQGTGRPAHEMGEHASGMNDKMVRGYDACSMKAFDGSRFELRFIAVEDQPWHVVDHNNEVKKFNTQEEAEEHIRKENRKALEEEDDDRKELHYRAKPPKKAPKGEKSVA